MRLECSGLVHTLAEAPEEAPQTACRGFNDLDLHLANNSSCSFTQIIVINHQQWLRISLSAASFFADHSMQTILILVAQLLGSLTIPEGHTLNVRTLDNLNLVLQIRTESAPLSMFITNLSAHFRRAKLPLLWPQTLPFLDYMNGSLLLQRY